MEVVSSILFIVIFNKLVVFCNCLLSDCQTTRRYRTSNQSVLKFTSICYRLQTLLGHLALWTYTTNWTHSYFLSLHKQLSDTGSGEFRKICCLFFNYCLFIVLRYPTDACPLTIVTMCFQFMWGVMTQVSGTIQKKIIHILQTLMAGIIFSKLARPIKRAATLIFSKNAVLFFNQSQNNFFSGNLFKRWETLLIVSCGRYEEI